MAPGAPDHLGPVVNDLALLKTARRHAQQTGAELSDQLEWQIRHPVLAVETLTAGEFAMMEVLDRTAFTERAAVDGLLMAQSASPGPSVPWHGLYGGLPWRSFPADDATIAGTYPTTRGLGLIPGEDSLGIVLVDGDRRPLTEALVFDLDDVGDVAELVLLCRVPEGGRGAVLQGDRWTSAAAATIDLEDAFCDVVMERLRPWIDSVVSLGQGTERWDLDVFAGHLLRIAQTCEDSVRLWRDLLPPTRHVTRAVPTPRSADRRDGATAPAVDQLKDVVVAQRLRRLWTDILGPSLTREGHDLGQAWSECSLERRGKVLPIHSPYDFGEGKPLAGIHDWVVERLVGTTGGRVDRVEVVDRSPSRMAPPRRRSSSSLLDVFHRGDPVDGLSTAASEIRRRLVVDATARPGLAEIGLAAVSRWRVWLVADSADTRNRVGSTPGAAYALHDAIRRWQGTDDPQFDVIADLSLWAESPGIMD